jgi:PHD/YefM family antitoxin component YafN of YafNO toxin-antitoxin module
MKTPTIIYKFASDYEIRRHFGKIKQNVLAKGERYLIKRHGETIAVVVPVEVYEQWRKSRERYFATLRIAQKNANLNPEEAETLAAEAVTEARRKKHQAL